MVEDKTPDATGHRETGSAVVLNRPEMPDRVMRVNVRFLLAWAVAAVVVGVGLFATHRVMCERVAGGLYERAASVADDDPGRAIDLLGQYLSFRPRDYEATRRLADLVEVDQAETRARARRLYGLDEVLLTAFEQGEYAIADGDEFSLRRRLAENLIRLGRYREALDPHLSLLVARAADFAGEGVADDGGPGDSEPAETLAELRLLEGACHRGRGDTTAAMVAFLQAATADPSSVDQYRNLLTFIGSADVVVPSPEVLAEAGIAPELRDAFGPDGEATAEDDRSRLAAAADDVLDLMVARGRPRSEAFLARAAFRLGNGSEKLDEAAADVVEAERYAGTPDERQAWLRAAAVVALGLASRAEADGKTAAAEAHLADARSRIEEGLTTERPDPEFYKLAARAEIASLPDGETARAEALVELSAKLEKAAEDMVARTAGAAESKDIAEARRFKREEHEIRWTLTDVLIRRLTSAESESGGEDLDGRISEQLGILEDGPLRVELVDLHRARIAMHRRDYRDAATLLEQTRATIGAVDAARSIDPLLIECYAQLGNDDAVERTVRRAIADRPGEAALRLRLARELASRGAFDDALRQCRAVSSLAGALEAGRIALDRCRSRPPKDRDLASLEEYIARLREEHPDVLATGLLASELAILEGDLNTAGAILDEVATRHPDEVAVPASYALLESIRGRHGLASDRLDRAFTRFGDDRRLIAAGVMLAVRLEERDARIERLRSLETRLATMTATDRLPAARTITNAYATSAVDSFDDARRLARDIVEEFPDDLRTRVRLFETAETDGERDRQIAEIERIEGPDGPFAGYLRSVSRVRAAASSGDLSPRTLELVRDELARVTELRPRWTAPVVLRAEIERIAGNEELSIEYAESAFALGDRSERTIGTLAAHYVRSGDFRSFGRFRGEIEAGDRSLVAENVERSLETASRFFDSRAERLEAIRTGVSRVAGSDDRAVTTRAADAFFELERLRDLTPRDRSGRDAVARLDAVGETFQELFADAPTAGWLRELYVIGLTRLGMSDAARGVVIEAEAALADTPAAAREATLARCFRHIGDDDEAASRYDAALRAAPGDLTLRGEVAGFAIRRGELDIAREQLVAIGEAPGASEDVARRAEIMLTLVDTARGGSYRDLEIALERLGEADSEAELRTRAALLARSPAASARRESIAVLEELARRPDVGLRDRERLRLAELYDREGRWADARAVYDDLIGRNPGDILLLARFAAKLIERGADEAAAARIDALEKAAPDSLVSVAARATLLDKQGATDRAVELLETFARRLVDISTPAAQAEQILADPDPDKALAWLEENLRNDDDARAAVVTARRRLSEGDLDTAGVLLDKLLRGTRAFELAARYRLYAVIGLFDQFGRPDLAERIFRDAGYDEDRAADVNRMIVLTLAQGRDDEALGLAERLWAITDPGAAANQAVAVLREIGDPTEAQRERVVALLDGHLRRNPGDVAVLVRLADFFDHRGDFPRAIDAYRRILATAPAEPITTNNLAWLLAATRDETDEALLLIDGLLARRGPIPALLDTRGYILVRAGRTAEAIEVLRTALDGQPLPAIRVTLALALAADGRLPAARREYAAALAEGLAADDVHPLLRSELERFFADE